MPPMVQRNGVAGDAQGLILTPSKLRLHSHVFGAYVTCMWLPNSVFAALLLFKIGHAAPLAWWMVFLPQWIGHAAHVLLLLLVLLHVGKLVRQQLGPAPPATASPGMMLQYTTMFSERRTALALDSICSTLETLAAAAVKAMICSKLTAGTLSSPTFSWRMLLLPCWVAWGLAFFVSLWKPRRERTVGTMRDLLFICLVFVALKLDGLAPYTWSVVFLIPWMWFGTLFLAIIVTAGVIVVAYACMDLRELALPGGFLLLLLAAAAQMPFFIFLASFLDGDASVTIEQILLPQVASWAAMWLAGLIICYGLLKKEQLRARLAAAGQVWTVHESAARELMTLELEGMQQQVDKMSNEELAQVAMRMMAGKVQPQQLLRVGSTLYKVATSSSAASLAPLTVMKRIDIDGTADLGDLSAAAAEGCDWAASAQHVSALEGAVCVSVQLMPRSSPQPPGTAAGTAVVKSIPGASGPPDLAITINDTSPATAGAPAAGAAGAAAAAAAAGAEAAGVEVAAAATSGDGEPDDDGLCTICFDRQASCVFMGCGHGGYCWRCAHVLYARPPNECPICRRQIDQVVELEDPSCQVGRPARVKPATVPPPPAAGERQKKPRSGAWFRV